MRMNGKQNGLRTVNTAHLNTAIAETARFGGTGSRMVGDNGELNAQSVQELARVISSLSSMAQSGQFSQAQEEVASASERRETLLLAYNDPSGAAWNELGASIANEITDRVQRMGFMRRFLSRGDLSQGSIPRIRVKHHNVDAVMATGPVRLAVQTVRDKYIMPEEFYVHTNLRIEQRELDQGNTDVLQEKFLEGLEAIAVQEDRTFMALANRASILANDLQYYSGQVSPSIIGKLKEQVTRWSLPAVYLTIANDVLTDLTTGNGFDTFFDPVSRLEIITTGTIGTLLGTELITDGFRDPRLRVLNPGDIMVTTQPEYLGGYTDRGPITSEPRNNDKDFPGRGWYQYETISMALANARGVSIAKRI